MHPGAVYFKHHGLAMSHADICRRYAIKGQVYMLPAAF